MAALFGEAVSSMSAAPASAEPARRAPASAASPQPAADLNALIAEAAKDLADYQRLTAEGKLGEAGQKLEELKRALEKLNARQPGARVPIRACCEDSGHRRTGLLASASPYFRNARSKDF